MLCSMMQIQHINLPLSRLLRCTDVGLLKLTQGLPGLVDLA